MTDLLGLVPESARAALGAWLAERGEPPYRTRQILPRLWQRPVASWEDATELPERLRRALPEAFPLRRLPVVARQVSSDGTEKYLWDLGDGEAVESVLIPEGKRRTLCISSQVGCALGCVFCATGRMGFRRNLAPAEIAGQVRELLLDAAGQAPTNVVFMGMGEPLLNWEAVDVSLTILNHADGFGIGARHITVSTVGILANLAQLARRAAAGGCSSSGGGCAAGASRRCCEGAAGSTSAPRAGSYGWNSSRGAKSAPRNTLASSSFVVSASTVTRPTPNARRTWSPTAAAGRRTTMRVESSVPTAAGAFPKLTTSMPACRNTRTPLLASPLRPLAFNTSTVTRRPPSPGTRSVPAPAPPPPQPARPTTSALSARRASSRTPPFPAAAATRRSGPA